MRLVLSCFAVAFALSINDQAFCQITNGKYLEVPCVSGENCIELQLSKGKFHIEKTGSLGSKIGEGYFIEKKDSLILKLSNTIDIDSSRYVITNVKQVSSESSPLILNVKVAEEDGTPIRYAWISYYNNTEMLAMNFADSTGKSTFWIYNRKIIDNVRFCMFGYKCITIPLNVFEEGENTIDATLKPVSSYQFNGKELKFKIVKRKHSELELTNSEYTLRLIKE